MTRVVIPYYYRSLDWNAFTRTYPPPKEFAEGMFLWPRGKIRRMQNQRFREILEYAWAVPFYHKRWAEKGLAPRDINGLDDIEKLPVISVYDFKEEIQGSPPYGSWYEEAIARYMPIRIITTGGTTGKPRPVIFTPTDWEINALTAARALFIQGARPGDTVQIPATLALQNFGWIYYYASHAWLGALPVTTGSGKVTPTKRQLELAAEWGATIWCAFPDYLVHLATVARETAGFEVADLKTKFLHSFVGSDHSGKFRKSLEDLWGGTTVYANYGNVDMGLSFECPERHGYHFSEDFYYLEIVEPGSGDPVPPGEEGELVITSFYRRYPPLIRYSTKDIVRWIDYGERCGCGSAMLRMDHFISRSDDMVKIQGTSVFPGGLQDCIRSEERATGEYLCIVNTVAEGPKSLDTLTVKIEYRDEGVDRQDFERSMEERIKTDHGIRVAVEPVPAGSLAELTHFGDHEKKVVRLIDNRGRDA